MQQEEERKPSVRYTKSTCEKEERKVKTVQKRQTHSYIYVREECSVGRVFLFHFKCPVMKMTIRVEKTGICQSDGHENYLT